MSDQKPKKKIIFSKNDEVTESASETLSDLESNQPRFGDASQTIIDQVNASKKKQAREEKVRKAAPQISFATDPARKDVYNGAWRKRKLLPDSIIKDVCLQDSLIAAILRARANVMSMFGHVRRDRFDIGLELKVKPEIEPDIDPEQMDIVSARMDRAKNLLVNCGHVDGIPESQRVTFPEFLYRETMDALRFGRIAVESIYSQDPSLILNPNEQGLFHRFRPVDASTIFKIYNPKDPSFSSTRRGSERPLSRYGGEPVEVPDLDSLPTWMQEIDGIRQQVYTDKEMLSFNFYPVNDVEANGYPITPLDTCVNAVTTHISIEVYNKLFFQNGRGAKGALAIFSDMADQDTIDDLKQQYMAGVNDLQNAFRTPMIGLGPDDKIQWVPMESSSKDGEFQFLYDQIARNILSAFGMSPSELAGYGHLDKGTNNQALSDSNNEWKMTAARDTGLRPLILKWEEFLNHRLFPILDPELSQLCTISFGGLDAQSRDQEAVRLTQESGLHMTYDEVRKGVDKPIIGDRLGGQFPYSERYQLIADKYVTAGELISEFLKDPTARLDTTLKFQRDPFYLQFLQLLMQVNPAAVQAKFVTRDDAMEIFKFVLQDYLDEED